ncbi:MAG: hypothetical protein WAN35_12630 [Terracidiphilus sp.]
MIDWIRKILARLAMLLFTAALGAHPAPGAAQALEWKTYSYPAQGFSASFPSKPILQKRDIPTATGCFLRSYLAKSGPASFFVGICEHGAAAAGKNAGTMLQGAKNEILSNSNSHLVSEKKITLGNCHGVEFEADNYEAHFSARIYMAGTTLYQTLTVFPLGRPNANAKRFLDSFQLIARVEE